jgi:1-acyl-sn-glycerol-3-phosphate acyltransferase
MWKRAADGVPAGAAAWGPPWIERAWGLWARSLFIALCALAWPFAVCAPRALSRRLARGAAHLWLLGAFVPVRVDGLERLARARRPWVAVANHTSKLDGIVLAALLPPSFGFVAKAELAEAAWLRWPLERLGVLFVQPGGHGRDEPSALARAAERLRRGDSLLWFPEGRILDRPGLLPFHRGAFVAALEASACVVPIALRGTRSVLPDWQKRPRRGRIQVEVGAPIETRGMAEDAVPRLCEEARRFVASRCGEPDLCRKPAAAFGSTSAWAGGPRSLPAGCAVRDQSSA